MRFGRRDIVVCGAGALFLAAAIWLSLTPALRISGAAAEGYTQATRAYDDAVAAGDLSRAGDWVTGNALIQLRSQVALDAQEGYLIRTTRSPSSFQLLDGSDGSASVQVRETGVEKLEFAPPPGNAIAATRDRTYDRVITLRRNGSGYQLANQSETSAPAGWWELWAKTVARGLLVAGAALLLVGLWVLRRRRPAVAGGAPVPGSQPASEVPRLPDAPDRNTITCFGGLRVTVDGEDMTSRLLARPVVAFIWVFLLAHEIRHPGARLSRASLAEEVFPGLPSQTQRQRLRDRLRDIREALPPAVGAAVVQVGDAIGFDPVGWSVDAVDLQRLALAMRTSASDHGRDLWLTFEQRWNGEFIPEWEELEAITEGRGTSHEFIAELRVELEAALVDTLNVAVARLLVVGDAVTAIRVAERASNLRPDREDVRNILARAYAQAGRHQAAADAEAL
jgi:hypothetical protein